jgi:hypothetical protein
MTKSPTPIARLRQMADHFGGWSGSAALERGVGRGSIDRITFTLGIASPLHPLRGCIGGVLQFGGNSPVDRLDLSIARHQLAGLKPKQRSGRYRNRIAVPL